MHDDVSLNQLIEKYQCATVRQTAIENFINEIYHRYRNISMKFITGIEIYHSQILNAVRHKNRRCDIRSTIDILVPQSAVPI